MFIVCKLRYDHVVGGIEVSRAYHNKQIPVLIDKYKNKILTV